MSPTRNTALRHVTALADRSLADLPAIGAKAAQFAELYRIRASDPRCSPQLTFSVPPQAFAIPIAHYLDHFVASGAASLLHTRSQEATFRADPRARAAALHEVQQAIVAHPIDPQLLTEIEAAVRARFGQKRVRFRSSSNVEDLPTFNGAGLHTSASAQLDDDERPVSDALRTVWASLWNTRAYDERERANIDQEAAAMGVLVHEAYAGEMAQGVAISRDLLDPSRGDLYYLNTQIGEAAVTNPAPGVITEELLYAWSDRDPELRYHTRSSLTDGAAVLSIDRVRSVACALGAVHAHFMPLIDPHAQNRLFAMQIEFKFDRSGALVVKQARPQPFAGVVLPADCRW